MTSNDRDGGILLGIERGRAVENVMRRLEELQPDAVHVQGPPGFGKEDFVECLARRLPKRAIAVRLAEGTDFDADPMERLWLQLDEAGAQPAELPSGGWDERLAAVAARLRTANGRPLLLISGADHLQPVEPDGRSWPGPLLDVADVVTVSLAPVHLIFPAISRQAGEAMTVRLSPFPPPHDGFDDFDAADGRHAQPDEEYRSDGAVWFERYLAARPGTGPKRAALSRVFNLKYEERRQELWGGHPLVNVGALEAMLDSVLADGRAQDAIDSFRERLAKSRYEPLGQRLLPFTCGTPGAVAPAVAEAIASAVKARAEEAGLNALQKEWLLASGMCTTDSTGGRLSWAKTATLIVRNPDSPEGRRDMVRWAQSTLLSARAAMRGFAERQQQNDKVFRLALDRVNAIYRESDRGAKRKTRIERPHCRIIVPEKMFLFRLSEISPEIESRKEGPDPKRTKFDLLVFDTAVEGVQLWRHQVRILGMLGRMRHPALRAYDAGGELRTDNEEESGTSLVFIEVTRALDDLGRTNVRELVRLIDDRDLDIPADESPRRVFSQIVRLAEALDLIHAQGIIHRTLDFSALQIDRAGEAPQLVLTGFEYSASLRAALEGDHRETIPDYRQAGWNLACRAPEWNLVHRDEVDPAIDVYAFGALACMLATGLPDEDVLVAMDLALPTEQQLADAQSNHEAASAIERARELLRDDLLREDRWSGSAEPAARLRALIHLCLQREPVARPTMEDLAPQLREWNEEYLDSFVRSEGILHVSYPHKEMGNMLKKLRLIDEEKNLESPAGEAWLRTQIQGWINSAKWMHFRESGFPKGGDDRAVETRRDAKFIFASPGVVFFAAYYRENPGATPDHRFLWLAYAMRRSEILLPDPGDPQRDVSRTTDEEISWIRRPAQVEVVAKSDISELDHPLSWEPTLERLTERGSLHGIRRLGREAATVWRIHRDIELAREAIRTFPVSVTKADDYGYIVKLDEDEFRRANERQSGSFLRQVLLEGKNLRAFFVDTVQAMADAAGQGQLNVLIRPRGKDRRRNARSLVGTIELPIMDNAVRMQIEDDANVPAQAEIVWFDRFGTEVSSARQSEAIDRLERRTWLLDYLVTPRDCGRLLRPISGSCDKLIGKPSEHVKELERTVKLMLSSDPLHAVQGPPGTGKTTLIAALVAEVLAANDGARILVTSQSHAATDNVLLAVTNALDRIARVESDGEDGRPTVAIRLFSESTRDQVDHEVRRRYSIDAQVRAAETRMRKSAAEAEHGQPPGSHLAKACEQLRKAVATGYLETRFKIERSAALIFSTTGAAMTSVDYLKRGAIGYDYVLIDEAAKAWAVDLVQPLAIADRAILVGDQEQLPPFGDLEIKQILTSAQQRRRMVDNVPPDFDELLEATARPGEEAPFDRMQGWLKLFHRLFNKAAPPPAGSGADRIPLTQSLDRQFRSVPAIGTLISKTFYSRIGGIQNAGPAPDTDKRLPIRLRSDGRPLSPAIVWLDTSEVKRGDFYSKRVGSGLRNAGEVSLVADLLADKLDLGRSKKESIDPWERLRILSPYKEQVHSLRRHFREHQIGLGLARDDVDALFQTVDGSQGSEADIVVISFCRRLPPEARKEVPNQSLERRKDDLKNQVNSVLGFLQLPERANVMMSRARHQLVIVGDFQFFKRGAALLDEWQKLAGDPNEPSFWTQLLGSFRPFDEQRDRPGEDLERAVVLPVQAVEGLGECK